MELAAGSKKVPSILSSRYPMKQKSNLLGTIHLSSKKCLDCGSCVYLRLFSQGVSRGGMTIQSRFEEFIGLCRERITDVETKLTK